MSSLHKANWNRRAGGGTGGGTGTSKYRDACASKNADAVARHIKQKEENNEITRSLEKKTDILKENELKSMILKTS